MEREGGDSVPRHTRKARVPGEFQFHLLRTAWAHVKAEAGSI